MEIPLQYASSLKRYFYLDGEIKITVKRSESRVMKYAITETKTGSSPTVTLRPSHLHLSLYSNEYLNVITNGKRYKHIDVGRLSRWGLFLTLNCVINNIGNRFKGVTVLHEELEYVLIQSKLFKGDNCDNLISNFGSMSPMFNMSLKSSTAQTVAMNFLMFFPLISTSR